MKAGIRVDQVPQTAATRQAKGSGVETHRRKSQGRLTKCILGTFGSVLNSVSWQLRRRANGRDRSAAVSHGITRPLQQRLRTSVPLVWNNATRALQALLLQGHLQHLLMNISVKENAAREPLVVLLASRAAA